MKIDQWNQAAPFRRAGDGATTRELGVDGRMIGGCVGWWATGQGDVTLAGQQLRAANTGMMALSTEQELAEPPSSLALALGLLATFCATMRHHYQPAVFVFGPSEWRAVDAAFLMPHDLIVVLFGSEVAIETTPGLMLNAVWKRFRCLDTWASSNPSGISIQMDKWDKLAHAIHSLGNYLAYSKEDQHLADWPPFGVVIREPAALRLQLLADMEGHTFTQDGGVSTAAQYTRDEKRWRESLPKGRSLVRGGLLMALVGGAATAALKGFKEEKGREK